MTDLRWGETPFDTLTRDEMLHELRVQFNALMRASSALHVLSYHDLTSPFWGPTGTGGRALRQVNSVVDRVNEGRNDGQANISRSYFRYADELLFPEIDHGPERWWINVDGVMTKTADPNVFPVEGWNQDWRLLTLDDLKPLPDSDTGGCAPPRDA